MKNALLFVILALAFVLPPRGGAERIDGLLRQFRASLLTVSPTPTPTPTPTLTVPTDIPAHGPTPFVMPPDITLTPNTACPPGYYSENGRPGCHPFITPVGATPPPAYPPPAYP